MTGSACPERSERETSSRSLQKRSRLFFGLLILIWGLSFVFIKIGVMNAPPLLFAGLRTFMGGLVLVPVALWRREPLKWVRHWRTYVVSALVNVFFFAGLQTLAMAYLPSGLTSVLIYLQPIFVGVLEWVWLRLPVSGSKLAGLLVGFVGVAIIGGQTIAKGISGIGVGFGVLAALAWAVGTVYLKKIPPGISFLWLVAIQFMMGSVSLILAGSLSERWSQIHWNGPFEWSLAYSGFLALGLAWLIWVELVAENQASVVAAYIFAVPVVSVATGILLMGEPYNSDLSVGILAIVSGIYLVNRATRPRLTDRVRENPSDQPGAR